MFWRKKPKNHPNDRNGASVNDAGYRWNDDKWRGGAYPHWDADHSDYQADERNFWRHQVWAVWTNAGVSIAILAAAVAAGIIAYRAYQTGLQTVSEAKRQTEEARRQANEAKRQADAAESQLSIVGRYGKTPTARLCWRRESLQTTINGSTLFSRRSYQVRLNVRNFGQTPAYKTV